MWHVPSQAGGRGGGLGGRESAKLIVYLRVPGVTGSLPPAQGTRGPGYGNAPDDPEWAQLGIVRS